MERVEAGYGNEASVLALHVAPCPILDLWWVFEVRSCVCHRLLDQIVQLGDPTRRLRAEAGRTLERFDGEMVPTHSIEDGHVEGGRGRALLIEAADMETFGVDPPMDNFVHRPLVAVK